ncbi:Uncharacterised protein [Budvicia aquatica]|uniref:Uncharacterized protein n=1 Tax=Budvicia aquatica TaxID=82979 RepID=A0A2C6CYE7_9GAMM|nr:hypothetical protein CRN84_21440 [Budvicia aquatica]VFS52521.1 Uncharacterised protein [Budvicia aquatica]
MFRDRISFLNKSKKANRKVGLLILVAERTSAMYESNTNQFHRTNPAILPHYPNFRPIQLNLILTKPLVNGILNGILAAYLK